MKQTLLRRVASVLLVTMTLSSLPVRAEMVSTEQILAPAASGERGKVSAFLSRADVIKELQGMGVDPVTAQQRVAALSDDEVHQLYGHIQTLPAGGMDLLGTLVFIFVLLLVTDILGLTKVFPFTRPVHR